MLGNWATGKLRIVRAPTSTMTMEMTMATMGRLMKNFDIGSPSLSCRRVRPGGDQHAWPKLLETLNHHALAGL